MCRKGHLWSFLNHDIIAVPLTSRNPHNLHPDPLKKRTQTTNQQKQRNRNKLRIYPAEFYVSFYCGFLCSQWIRFVPSNKGCQHSISSGNHSVLAQLALISGNIYPEQQYQKHLHVVEWTGTAFLRNSWNYSSWKWLLSFFLIYFFFKYTSKFKLFEFLTHLMLCYCTTKLNY